MSCWPLDPRAPRVAEAPWLFLVDGPIGPAFVSPSIVAPCGRSNLVTDEDGGEYMYTVFWWTPTLLLLAHDPGGKLSVIDPFGTPPSALLHRFPPPA